MEMRDLAGAPGEWLKGTGPQSDVVISSRIRLARNLVQFPFLSRATDEQKQKVLDIMRARLAEIPLTSTLTFADLSKADPVDRSLPFASTLCGACYEVCPVRIDIPRVLVHLRAKAVDHERRRLAGLAERAAFRAATVGLGNDVLYAAGLRLGLPLAHAVAGEDGFSGLPLTGARWTDSRDVVRPPRQSFRAWWRQQQDGGAP